MEIVVDDLPPVNSLLSFCQRQDEKAHLVLEVSYDSFTHNSTKESDGI